MFAALQLAAILCCANSQLADLTLVPGAKGKSVVRSTVRKIAESGIFQESDFLSLFLRRMAFAETNDGVISGDGGIWAISEVTLRFTKGYVTTLARGSEIGRKIKNAFGFDWVTTVLVDNCEIPCNTQKMNVPLYSALAVMIYLNVSGREIPEDKDSQVMLWKEVFKSYTKEKTDRFNDYIQGISIIMHFKVDI